MIDTETLRKKAIDLAIEGKLTVQLPEDGNAEILMEQIAKEKKELIQQGKIPKEKKLPDILEEDIPFDLPTSWKWVRVQDVASYITDYVANGSFATLKEHTKTYREPNYAIFVRTMDFGSEFKEGCSYIDEESYNFLEKSKLFGGELILPNIGASIGKAFVMPDLGMPMSLAPNSILLKFLHSEMNEFFSIVVKSTYGQKLLNKTQGGSATAKFSKTDLRSLVVPLPPIDEQKRIVEKLNIVFAQIGIIDALQQQYESDREILKGKIIDAGIRGRLTEQLPEDGNAEDLYVQIQEEKAKLIKEGKIKKEKPLPEISDDEIPFEIPKTWKWVRFGDLMWNRDSERIPVSVADRKKLSKNYDYYGASGVIDKVENYIYDEKLLLIGEDGANLVSRSTPIAFIATGKYWVNNHAHVLGCYKYDYLDFVMHYINSISLIPYVTGSAQPKLNQENMNKIPVPLPPYKEMIRILNRINEVLF